MSRSARRIARHSFDLLIFGALCVAVYAVRWFEPYKRGFFCSDDSLRYPHRDGTIGSRVLVAVVLAVPGLVILAVELFRRHEPNALQQALQQQQQQRRKQQTIVVTATSVEGGACATGGGSGGGTGAGGYRLVARVCQCYAQLGYYLFGLGLTVLCTELTKRCVGRLRPHFFAVCQPVLPDGSSCADAANANIYVPDYACGNLNATARQLGDLGQSFPSGHSSIIFYGMLYTAIYLQAMLSTRISKLLKHMLQFVFVLFAWYVALTRIADFMHHWTDVLAGAVLGAAMAIYTAIFMAGLCWRRDFLRCGGGGGGASGGKTAPACGTALTLPSMKSGATATPVLPAYTFGTLPYMQHPYAPPQSYHNYGYVP